MLKAVQNTTASFYSFTAFPTVSLVGAIKFLFYLNHIA
jgi:hypothetical protein